MKANEKPDAGHVVLAAIVILAAVLTLVDAVTGSISLRKLSIGLSMLCTAFVVLIGPRHPRLVPWLIWIGAALAVGYFVFWAVE